MTLQYGRKVSIIVSDDSGNALELNQFKCRFNVRRGDNQTPNSCDLRVWNLATNSGPGTANKIAANEFTTLTIQAGYEGNYGLIFSGSIRQTRKGRESAKDSYVDITAGDGDRAYNFAVVSQPLAKATAGGILQQIQNAVKSFGITPGPTPTLNPNQAARGRTLYGPFKSVMRRFAAENDCTWSIQDGQLTLIPHTGFVQQTALIVSPDSGLIGVPEQTENGIEFRMLLNPSVKIGTCINLQGPINQLRYGLEQGAQAQNEKLKLQVPLDGRGLYYTMIANHNGDTRGNAWETHVVCLSVDASVPPDIANSNRLFAIDVVPRT